MKKNALPEFNKMAQKSSKITVRTENNICGQALVKSANKRQETMCSVKITMKRAQPLAIQFVRGLSWCVLQIFITKYFQGII
ncbi:MAG: hypothetical protein HXX11_17250 [Desulfuromonadales bacterium]|nr:hypothetical protein [Desulfuromonadales bacterium]